MVEQNGMKVVIATDGSKFSEKAIGKYCEIIGSIRECSVKLVSVYEPQTPAAAEPFAFSGEYYEKLDELARARAQQAADSAEELLIEGCENASNEIEKIVKIGRPAQVIIDTAKSWPADMIVVGSHGRGFWGRLTLGSVSNAVLHHAECSVLVVK